MNTTSQAPQNSTSSSIYLSEIFPLTILKPNLICFRLTPEVDREVGNRLSWRFSQKFAEIVVIWENKYFWVLAKPTQKMPSPEQWRQALGEILEQLKEDIGDHYYSIQWVRDPQVTASTLAQLAVRVLKIRKPFSPDIIFSENQVQVQSEVDFWPETIELANTLTPAITLTLKSRFLYRGTLAEFYANHPYRNKPKELLVGLKVRDRETNSSATIVEIAAIDEDRRKELIEKATGAVSRQALEEAPDDQPLVSVRFGKNQKLFDYPMEALCPSITKETASKFDVNYGDLIKQTKPPYQERQNHLTQSKQKAEESLAVYGFQIDKSINNLDYPSLFQTLQFNLEDTELLFGKDSSGKHFVSKRGSVLKGLSQGGVYRRHQDYENYSTPIRISLLNLCNSKVGKFVSQVEERLKQYKFETIRFEKDSLDRRKEIKVDNLDSAEARVAVEKALDELMVIPTNIVLTFLPESDRHTDDTEDGSFYSFVSSRLLRRGISSQVIYEDTLKNPNNYSYILNQVIPGILAKLGNLPFILAKPLEIADYFIGLDISRTPKKRKSGSLNVCASVRLYGKYGEFIRYRLEDALTQGEEIDKRTLERFLPAADLSGKTVLIYRDGRFCGDEIKHLRERAKAMGSKFILVECIKSGIPRLYEVQELTVKDKKKPILKAPPKGLALRLSSHEVMLVTTEVKSEKMGLPNPLRLKVIPEEGQQVSLESLVEATLKLTLLHHGSLKEPRLPIPLYGSDIIAYRRLQGISPGELDGDRQFWL
ncbi:Piwi domain-containing protein [Lyngbya sp. PCC 8106]|uniref:Piwi domain-containing protein n=1 Tax=Lyngbya sp. (strain PCC 8106) TaxID=313612 RepID=UPI0000EAD44F|nr:Piwi domain-containing protein [Lyngbya sp. PCC 8106]EAW33836.1 hypothetical protein L8106_18222 [Lyngbya sp. PCC 8106]